jgi:hypothetical protein
VLGDQREQQVEGPLEDVEVHLEGAGSCRAVLVIAGQFRAHGHDGSGFRLNRRFARPAGLVLAETVRGRVAPAVLVGPVLTGTVLTGTGRVGAVGVGDPAGQQAVLATGVEVGEQDGDGLTDDSAPVGGGAVAQQREPGAFQVK